MTEQKVKLVIEPELSVEENNLKIIENINETNINKSFNAA